MERAKRDMGFVAVGMVLGFAGVCGVRSATWGFVTLGLWWKMDPSPGPGP